MAHVVIFAMAIISTNIVLALCQIDLYQLFYPKSKQTTENFDTTSTATQIKEDLKVKSLSATHDEESCTDYISASIMRNMTAYDQEQLAQSRQDTRVADVLGKRIRLLCLVMTYRKNREKAIHVRNTWGKKCDVLLFLSTEHDKKIPTVKLPVPDGKKFTWGKTKAAFKYAYNKYLYEADWFMKTDDDTYVIVENLKYFLNEYNTNDPIYFGCRFKIDGTKEYYSGGAGYVLSKEALTLFVTKGLNPDNPRMCKIDHVGVEDVELGVCMNSLGVIPVDSRDQDLRGRFFPFNPHGHVQVKQDPYFWYWEFIYYSIKTGRDCCSEYSISFHYIPPNMMYIMEYFVYHLRPYGISYYCEVMYNN